MAILVTILVVVLIFVFHFLSDRKKSIEEGTWLGIAGVKANYIWNHASSVQRQLMLAAIGILDGAYRDGLLSKKYGELPDLVKISLAQTLEEIGKEGPAYTDAAEVHQPLSPPAGEASIAQKHAHYKELASQHLLAKSKDYTDEERDALLESYRGAINATPEMAQLANIIKMGFDGEFQLASEDNLIRGVAEQENGALRAGSKIGNLSSENLDFIANGLAVKISQAFSASRFTQLFKEETLSEGWTIEDALVVWYSLGHLVLAVAANRAYNDKATMLSMFVPCRLRLLDCWNMSDDMFEKLRTVVNETKEEAYLSFAGCKNGADLALFFARYASRILGAPVPFSERSMFEDEMMGIKYQSSNPILHATICELFIGNCRAAKAVLEKFTV